MIHITQDTSVSDLKLAWPGIPHGKMPLGFEHWDNTAQAFREMFQEASRSFPKAPRWQSHRGVVICGGGWKFFPSVYVTVRMLRHVGCELPVQVWYLGDLGECDPRMMQALEPYNVGWIDANAFSRDVGPWSRVLSGWEMKAFAACYCPYREVLSLDADCYPVYNPEQFLDHPTFRKVGAAFWPDNDDGLKPGQWDRFGVARHREPGWESGQFAVDKKRQWAPLWLAYWMNQFSDYVYKHIYGDKDTFHLAWRKMRHPVCVPSRSPGWHKVAFLQKDFEGNTLFIHRVRDKFRWAGVVDGKPVPDGYHTEQWTLNTFVEGLPHEKEAHRFLEESSELVRPEQHFRFREGTWDREIWAAVNLRNEYRLPRSFSEKDVIVDVGGHIGSFVHACLSRGAGKVIVCEPDPGNLELLRANLLRYGDRVQIIPRAVWHEPVAYLTPATDSPLNTGGVSACRPGGVPVETITLNDVLRMAGSARLLKLDCEGAEYFILPGTDLSTVREICGEAHILESGGRVYDDGEIRRLLGPCRWDSYHNGPNTSLFYALSPGREDNPEIAGAPL